jgi:hypothetical protein
MSTKYHESGLDGTFASDLGDALDSITSLGLDEIIDLKDLEAIQNRIVEDEGRDEAMQEEGETTEEEDEPMDEEQEQTYDPNDF